MSSDTFELYKPSRDVFNAINESCETHRDEIAKLMKLMISKIADGFDLQRCAVFRFSTHAEDDTGSLVKMQLSLKRRWKN